MLLLCTTGIFSKKFLSLILITHLLLAQCAEAGVIKQQQRKYKREIATNSTVLGINDPEIVAIESAGIHATTVATFAATPKIESENVTPSTSTKLIAQPVNSRKHEGNELKLILNRVELNSKEDAREIIDESRAYGVSSHAAKDAKLLESNEFASEIEAAKNMHEASAESSKVFSHQLESSKEFTKEKTATINNNNVINDGLDIKDMTEKDASKTSADIAKDESAATLPQVATTTEEILPELEKIALNFVAAFTTNKTVNDTQLLSKTFDSNAESSEYARSMLHSQEDVTKDNFEITTFIPFYALGKAKLEKSTEQSNNNNNNNAHFAEELHANNELEGTSTQTVQPTQDPLTLPYFLISTTAATLTTKAAAELSNYTSAVGVSFAKSHENSIEESLASHEERRNGNANANSSSEKRAKFINDNSTNAQQLNLPNAAEVWSLAGLKVVPPSLNATTTTKTPNVLLSSAVEKVNNELMQSSSTTEKTLNLANNAVNSNSEKNLLDWSKIMLNGGFGDDKKYENLIEHSSTTIANELDIAKEVSIDKSVDIATTTAASVATATEQPLPHDDKHTELLINSHLYTRADELEKLAAISIENNTNAAISISTSTHLPNGLNEITIESTTIAAAAAAADAGVSNKNPELMTTYLASRSTTAMPAISAVTAEALPAAAAAATTTAEFLDTRTNTERTSNILSNDNSDNGITNTTTTNKATSASVESAYNLPTSTIASTSSHVVVEPIVDINKIESKIVDVDSSAVITTTTQTPVLALPLPENHLGSNSSNNSMNLLPHIANNDTNNISDVTLNANKSNNTNDNADSNEKPHAASAAAAAAATDNPHNIDDDITLELSSSKTTTLSTLEASEVNTSAAAKHNEQEYNEKQQLKNIVGSAEINDISSAIRTTIITTTELPINLAIENTTNNQQQQQRPNSETAEVNSQIDGNNEVDLDTTNVNKFISSSTIKTTHVKTENKDDNNEESETTLKPTTTTTTSSINELLISNTTRTTTEATPIQEFQANVVTSSATATATATTTTTLAPSVVATATTSKTIGLVVEVDENSTATATILETTAASTATTTVTPAIVAENEEEPVHKATAAHESENSIETNVIDPLETTTTTTTVIVPTTGGGGDDSVNKNKTDVRERNPLGEHEHAGNNEDIGILTTTPTTTTTMGTLLLNNATTSNINSSATTTTTEPLLISLLDDTSTSTTTTTTTTTTTASSIATKIEEIYKLFSTSTTEKTATSSSTTTVPPPLTKSEIEVAVTTAQSPTTTTTMLPPALTTTSTPLLHAAIGGGGAGAATPTGSISSGNIQSNSAADTPETDVNVIIAITVSVIGVIALILLVAFLYLIRKRQKQVSYGQRCRPVSLDAYSLDNVSVLGSVRRKGASRASKRSYGNIAFDDPSLRHNVLTASELSKFVGQRSSIFEEFRDVPQITARADEVPQGCEDKNRYANVIPLPETRVVLQQQNDDDKTEYINANYVRGPKDAPNYYIACQAPLETTVIDFWRMIWEQQSRVIIQATDLFENGSEKCAEYLPPSITLDNHTTYGDFQITLKNREVKDKYAMSTIMLKNIAENESAELTHYWYKWPEAGVPMEEAPIIAMLLEARSSLKSYVNEQKEKSATLTSVKTTTTTTTADDAANGDSIEDKNATEMKTIAGGTSKGEINGNIATDKLKMNANARIQQGPLTIHCSPGTGRTGTIIACDMAIRSLETPKRSVDIPQIVYYVRRGRASAVQTKEQYEFIYKVANMYATKITNLSNDN